MTAPAGVPTPASCGSPRRVVVLGAGIAGLTAAHELAERGFDVTVYEPLEDERARIPGSAPGDYPPVKLGGLAGSQFSVMGTAGVAAGRPGQVRPFPGRHGAPRTSREPVVGEHGFRFFPAYYLHLWDMLQRIPLYVQGRPTARTVMDNVRRVVTQATTMDGKPSLVFPRESPRSMAEMISVNQQLATLGFSPSDIATFLGRVLHYLTTSPLRRAAELADMSVYDYFTGRTPDGGRRFRYTPPFDAMIKDMPKVLAAFDSQWGDARTNLTTYLQLYLQMDRRDDKADGVLNGPTTEAWFDHWYRHLTTLGVRFRRGSVSAVEPPCPQPDRPPHRRPKVRVVLVDGTTLTPDYVVLAVDAPTAERVTAPLRAAGTGGAVAGLHTFAGSVAPPGGPLQPADARPTHERDPFSLAEMGRVPWDRFQTLAGIQFYFDTEFQLVRGHIYYAGTEWGLSSINQQAMWECRPTLAGNSYVSILSVDVGDFNTPSSHVLDEHGHGKAACDCTADELAAEVWRQITTALGGAAGVPPSSLFPTPVWYALDRNLVFGGPPGARRPVRNHAPYLVPIVGDWRNRPAGEPWNPAGSSWIVRPTEAEWTDDLQRRHVWQARHGGYPVHHNSLVMAGTWTRTFTRMTTMEAACESGRHAVNAVLDHYVWTETGGADTRERTSLLWRLPFGFLDQGFSSPIRLPSPAGDYCFVFDIENREPLEFRGLRDLDTAYFLQGLPHPLDTVTPGGAPMTAPNDYTGNLLAYLQAWREYLEQMLTFQGPSWPTPSSAPPPPGPPPTGWGPPGPPPPDSGPSGSGPPRFTAAATTADPATGPATAQTLGSGTPWHPGGSQPQWPWPVPSWYQLPGPFRPGPFRPPWDPEFAPPGSLPNTRTPSTLRADPGPDPAATGPATAAAAAPDPGPSARPAGAAFPAVSAFRSAGARTFSSAAGPSPATAAAAPSAGTPSAGTPSAATPPAGTADTPRPAPTREERRRAAQRFELLPPPNPHMPR